MDLMPDKRANASTNDDGLGRGMEFAILVLLFLGIGYGLDRWFGTKPVFMIVLVVLAHRRPVRQHVVRLRRADEAARRARRETSPHRARRRFVMTARTRRRRIVTRLDGRGPRGRDLARHDPPWTHRRLRCSSRSAA